MPPPSSFVEYEAGICGWWKLRTRSCASASASRTGAGHFAANASHRASSRNSDSRRASSNRSVSSRTAASPRVRTSAMMSATAAVT